MAYTKSELESMKNDIGYQNAEGFNVPAQRELVNQCLDLMEEMESDFSQIPQDVKDVVASLLNKNYTPYGIIAMLYCDASSAEMYVLQSHVSECIERSGSINDFLIFILKSEIGEI